MKKNLISSLTLLANLFVAYTAQGQENYLDWGQSIGGSSNEFASSVFVDTDDHIWLMGTFEGTVDFDPTAATDNHTTGGSSSNAFLQKTAADGTVLWVKSLTSDGNSFITDMTADSAGNLYIVGEFSGTVDLDWTEGEDLVTATGNRDVFVLKFGADGTIIWRKTFGGTSSEYAKSIVVNDATEIYVLGAFSGTVDFDPSAAEEIISSEGASDVFLQKMDASGNFLWSKTIGANSAQVNPTEMAIDAAGNLYFCGAFTETVVFDFDGTDGLMTSNGFTDAFMMKVDAEGAFQWVKQLGAGSLDNAEVIHIDASGDVLIGGQFNDTVDANPNAGVDEITTVGTYDVFVLKLSSDGAYSWSRSFGGVSWDFITGITTDSSNQIRIAGAYGETVNFNPEGEAATHTANGYYDPYMLSLNADGSYHTVTVLTNSGTNMARGIAVDSSNNSYLIGEYINTMDFDPGANQSNHTSAGNHDMFVLKLYECTANAITPSISNLPLLTAECMVDPTIPTATNNCGEIIYATTITDFPIITQGDTQITWTYTDTYGNSFDQQQQVSINDSTAPVPSNANLSVITAECSVNSVPTPTAIDNCGAVIIGTTDAVFPITDQGTTVITWTYDDGKGNISTQEQSIILDDVTNPNLSFISLTTIEAQCEITTLEIPVAMDACAGVVLGTPSISLPYSTPGATTIVWTYDDGHGNSVSQTQELIIQDTQAPVVDVVPLPQVQGDCEVLMPTPPTATDNCVGEVIGTTDAVFPITTEGITLITWTFDDGNGNSSTILQEIAVDDNTAPVADLESLPTIVADCAAAMPTAPTATDACSGAVTGTTDASFPITETSMIVWTYEDADGNVSTQEQEFVIENTIDATITQNGASLSVAAVGDSYQWIDCDNGNQAIAGATGTTYTATVNGNYAVEIKKDACTVMSDCVAVNTISVIENNSAFVLYPNPANGRVRLQWSETQQLIAVSVMDVLGRTVAENQYETTDQITLELGAEAYYIVKVVVDNDTVKIVRVVNHQ